MDAISYNFYPLYGTDHSKLVITELTEGSRRAKGPRLTRRARVIPGINEHGPTLRWYLKVMLKTRHPLSEKEHLMFVLQF